MTALMDPRIKLRHLNALVETVRQGGVGRAGEELGMTQPAISKALAELEEILGVALFDRSRRALSLTAHGELFERFARGGLATLRQGVDAVLEARSGNVDVAFGALPTVSADVVPRALALFAASPLACRARVESGPSPYLLELLRSAAIEFVVGRMAQPAAMDGLAFEQLYAEALALVVRPGHPLAGGEATLDAIAGYQLVMPPREAIIRPAVDALLIAGGVVAATDTVETVSNSLGRSYTLLTDAVWIISHGVVARDLESGALVRLPIDVEGTRGAIGITTRAGAELSQPARAMLDCVRQAVLSPSRR